MASFNVAAHSKSDLKSELRSIYIFLKISDDMSLVGEMSTRKVHIEPVGLLNGSDEDVFKKNEDKKFQELSA
jgi:hypothetical protein